MKPLKCSVCGNKTLSPTRLCAFCTPDPHEVAAVRDEYREEKAHA